MSISTVLLVASLAVGPSDVEAPDPAVSLGLAFAQMTTDDVLPDGVDGERAPVPPEYGAAGTRRWNVHGAGGFAFSDSDDTFGLVGLGVSQFIADGLSLDLELNAIFFDQEGPDATGLNGVFMVCWHFYRAPTWSIFCEFGAGLMGTTNDVPFDGSSFDFTPQAGFGVTVDAGSDVRLRFAIRWQHISNANTFSSNPGRDSMMFYLGFSFPF